MNKEIIQQVTKFFELRFPEKTLSLEMKCGYFWEWVGRFESGHPETYMDTQSLRTYKTMGEIQ